MRACRSSAARTQPQQKMWSPRDARAPLPEVRDDRAGWRALTGAPRRVVEAEHAERAVAVVDERRVGRRSRASARPRSGRVVVGREPWASARSPSSGSSGTSASVRSASRRSARSSPMNCGDEVVGRVGEDRVGRVVLREHAALAEDRDPVAHRDRLVDVVRDEDRPSSPTSRCSRRSSSCRRSRVIGSSAPNGSSISSSGGSAASARARPTRWRWPPESWAGIALGVAPARDRRARAARRCALASSPSVPAEQPRHGRDVLADRHVREEADLLDHVADPAPQLDDRQVADRCGRRCGCRPRRTEISRLTIFSAVVLPPPDGPTSTQNVPAGISSERSSSAAASRPGVALRHVVEDDLGRCCGSCSRVVPDPGEPDHAAGGDESGGDRHRQAEP